MRSFWSGIISFGLINIPIKLYSATVSEQLNFHFLRKKDMCPIKYEKVCSATGEKVAYEEIVKGFEFRKGEYVVVTEEDFKNASPKKTQAIEIDRFIDKDEIDVLSYDRPYYIEPDKGADKAYVLLREAMEKTGKAGIGKFVLRNKENLVALIVKNDLLFAETLRYKNEIRSFKELRIPKKAEFNEKELELAMQLINQMAAKFDYEQFVDTYIAELTKLIEEKEKGEIYKPEEIPAFRADVTDLMAKLKASLEKKQK